MMIALNELEMCVLHFFLILYNFSYARKKKKKEKKSLNTIDSISLFLNSRDKSGIALKADLFEENLLQIYFCSFVLLDNNKKE